MILEYKIDYRSSSLTYQKIFLQCLKKNNFNGKVLKDNFILKCYVEANESKEFEKFAREFSKSLPHSIFLYNTEVSVCKDLPEEDFKIKKQNKSPLPFCLDCLSKVMDRDNKKYYNIFTSCDVCGYEIKGKNKSYEKDFQQIAKLIKNGENIRLNTSYGTYTVGLLSNTNSEMNFDIIAYDYSTIKKYTHIDDFEIKAMASFEKPFLRLKMNLNFKVDFENVELDLLRFKLPDDFILHFLMEKLNKLEINLIFITEDKIKTKESLFLLEPKEKLEPIEVVVSQKHIAIIKGDKGLPKFPIKTKKIIPSMGAFYSIIKEHRLTNENIAGIYLSKKYQNTILVHGEKYGTIEYLSLEFTLKSIKDIFHQIRVTNNTGNSLINNYLKNFPDHYNRIINISFDNSSVNIYKLWGILSIILNFTPSNDILEASKILEENSISFLGSKGPRIDYKLIKIEGKTVLDPLMILRSAMSFKLAGVDNLTLSYGIVESFAEFISSELDNIKESMNISAVAISGSLLENKKFFAKLSKDCSINHNIYFNNQLLVDENNIFYGDSPEF